MWLKEICTWIFFIVIIYISKKTNKAISLIFFSKKNRFIVITITCKRHTAQQKPYENRFSSNCVSKIKQMTSIRKPREFRWILPTKNQMQSRRFSKRAKSNRDSVGESNKKSRQKIRWNHDEYTIREKESWNHDDYTIRDEITTIIPDNSERKKFRWMKVEGFLAFESDGNLDS